jgi:predicted nucleic acid-binding protein
VGDAQGAATRARPDEGIDLLIAATALAEEAVSATDDAALLVGDIPGLTVQN